MFEEHLSSVNSMFTHLYKQKYTARLSLSTSFVLPVVIVAFAGGSLGFATSLTFILICVLMGVIAFTGFMIYYSIGLKTAKEKMSDNDYQALLAKLHPPKKPLKERLSGIPLLIGLLILLYLLSILAMKLEERNAAAKPQTETTVETGIETQIESTGLETSMETSVESLVETSAN